MQLRTATLILLCCFGASTIAFAQKGKTKPKTEVEVIDFGEDSSGKSKEPTTYKGIILKTSPISFVFGRQPVELEKEINDFMSLQIGAGITFAPLWTSYGDLTAELLDESDGYCESEQWAYDECDYYSDYTIRTGKVGLLFSLSPRFFFESDGYEGMYVAPLLRFSTQKFGVQEVEEGLPYIERNPNRLQEESIKNFDLLVHYGSQALYPKLAVDWFIGAGIRFRNNQRQDVGLDDFFMAGNGERNFKDKKFRLEAGIRIGFQL